MEIKITCSGTRAVPVDQLKDFQGSLKVLTKKDLSRLKRQIIRFGFSFPVFVWGDSIIDGHHRVFAVKELLKEGHTIGGLPVVDIEARDRKEAAEKLLALNSRYAKITKDGLSSFIIENDLQIKDFYEDIALCDIDMDKFVLDFVDEAQSEKEKISRELCTDLSYQIIIECENETHQAELLLRLGKERVKCRPLML